MSIEVVIKQKLFGRKTIPLDVILGEDLYYGNYENDRLNVGEMGDGEILVYNPESIGRGFSVIWNEREKKAVSLRLLQPTSNRELKDFYAAVERIAKHWDGSLTVEGQKQSPEAFLETYQEMLEFNLKTIKDFAGQVLDGTYDTLALYAAKWPLSMGKEEAATFLQNPHLFEQWLHEKQNIDACYETPTFMYKDGEIVGMFLLSDCTSLIYPKEPSVPLGVMDPGTGKRLECKKWFVALALDSENDFIGIVEYADFLRLLPSEKRTEYDSGHFLLSRLTEEEVRAVLKQEKIFE